MKNSPIQPLSVVNPLASTPSRPPEFAVEVRRPNGEVLQVADPRATRAMVALMDMQAQMNGAASHWGGPSAFAELMSAFHAVAFDHALNTGRDWKDIYHFVNDAGHCENGIYALKANYGFAGLTLKDLRKFRSIESFLTGHGEAHLFPEGVYVSNGPLGSGLPQAQGLAFADALAGKDRVTVTAISDGGCMEGEARESLAVIPGLAQKGKMAPFVLLISDNNTKLSGRIDSDSYSMGPTFASLALLGWNVLHLQDGNNLSASVDIVDRAIAQAKANPKQPVAVHARTIKGFGVRKTMEAASGGHGFPLKEPKELKEFLQEIYGGQPVPDVFSAWQSDLEKIWSEKQSRPKSAAPAVPSEKVQVGVAKALIQKRSEGLPVVSVSADLQGSTGVADFQKKYPECTLDVGVAEANMVSTAIGLSKEGYIPVVDTFSQFGVTKGNLPLIMSSLSQGPMICIFSHVGFQDAADGASHQALTYFAATGSIPHVDVYALTSSQEAEALVSQAIDRFAVDRKAGRTPRTQIFFLGRENFSRRYLPEDYAYRLGRAQVVHDFAGSASDRAVTLVAAGALLGEALKAAEKLEADGIKSIVINPSIINHPDVECLRSALARTAGRMVTVEDHQVVGGMGAMLVHAMSGAGVPVRLRSLGVRDQFGQSAYSAAELYAKHGLDATAIVAAAKSLFS